MLNALKLIGLFLFGLLTLASGVCTAALLPSTGEAYVGWGPEIIGLPIVLISGLITWLLWRSLRQPQPPAPPKDEA